MFDSSEHFLESFLKTFSIQLIQLLPFNILFYITSAPPIILPFTKT